MTKIKLTHTPLKIKKKLKWTQLFLIITLKKNSYDSHPRRHSFKKLSSG